MAICLPRNKMLSISIVIAAVQFCWWRAVLQHQLF